MIVGAVVWPEGKPISTGPGKSASRSAIDGTAGNAAAGLVALRQLADDHGGGPREQARLAQLRDHSIEAIRPLADFIEKQHVAGRRIERKRRPERAPAAA